MFKPTSEQEKILPLLCGKLLGDGCITKQKGRCPRFQFIHTIYDKSWCFHCFDELKTDLPLSNPHYKKVIDIRISKGFSECFQVQSRKSPIITWLESIWYQERTKIIPFDFLEKYLNELALAWWYQDDGHLTKANNVPKKIILSTDNFTPCENKKIIEVMIRKFFLNFRLDSQNRIVLYDQIQIYYFLHLIEPYIHLSMKRKSLTSEHEFKPSKRTTVYLPYSITLLKPTSDINSKLSSLYTIFDIVNDREKYLHFYKIHHLTNLFSEGTKGYQIIINIENWDLLQKIKYKTGLTISQIIFLCFYLENNLSS